ncbi:unnamed protein product [Dibothriocephalus latus]|uniref:BPTI/Kunitz inhibitor domain-containing protein n=1 Tax=Dibothriocephalus latus TaxID=60516 RepID=A0A3P7R3Q1_DIBLA|nr:unnamed protein product [Dibothriocephalus latus]
MGFFRRFAYDPKLKQCVQFVYGGCQSNGNNFETKNECEKRCSRPDDICQVKTDPGPCKARIPRYSYDYKQGTCVNFTYGGCLGNGNNFKTKGECEKRCSGKQSTRPVKIKAANILSSIAFKNLNSPYFFFFVFLGSEDVCHLKADRGPCMAILPRFAYNSSLGMCVKFTYGGCQGNGNNFETKEDCEQTCARKLSTMIIVLFFFVILGSEDICRLKPAPGPCRGFMRRFAFNYTLAECMEFKYGGCQGNGNNFETKQQCENRCLLT